MARLMEAAMVCFYFDLIEGAEVIEDPEGSYHQDAAAARDAAILIARDLICGAVMRGELPLHHRIRICDRDHRVLETLRFDEAVSISR